MDGHAADRGLVWLGAALALRERVIRPLQTLANLLGALREGDFSSRARGARGDDALGLALLEVNTLSETLREQRIGALEATALLRTVMAEIDVAVLAFDARGEAAAGEPRRRAPPGPARARASWAAAPRSWGSSCRLHGERPAHLPRHLPRRRAAAGSCAAPPSARAASPTSSW